MKTFVIVGQNSLPKAAQRLGRHSGEVTDGIQAAQSMKMSVSVRGNRSSTDAARSLRRVTST